MKSDKADAGLELILLLDSVLLGASLIANLQKSRNLNQSLFLLEAYGTGSITISEWFLGPAGLVVTAFCALARSM